MAAGLLLGDGLLAFLGATPEEGAVFGLAKSYMFYILLGIPFQILMELVTFYLRNDNVDALAVALQASAGVGNLIVSAILLFFFDWGIEGCSFGFLVSNAATFLIGFVYLLGRQGALKVRRQAASFPEAIKPLRLGFATSFEYIFGAVFALVSIHLLTDLSGTEGVAIFNIVENLALLFVFIYELIGKMAQPIFSAFFAECNFGELHRIFRYCLLYSLALGGLATVATMVYPEVVGLLFGLDGIENTAAVYHAIRVFCVGAVFMGVCLLLQNYFQSEEDEQGAFLVVFLRRAGVGVALAWFLSRFGLAAFWLVYPLSELLTLLILFVCKRRRGEHKSINPARVYASTFYGSNKAITEQLDSIEAFAAKWGADERKRYLLCLALDEITGIVNERAARRNKNHVLLQLTLIARETPETDIPNFEIHLRDDAEEFDPFRLPGGPIAAMPERVDDVDYRALGMYVIRSRAQSFFFRNYQGFNTTVMVI
ncbi:MAG: hypothetical protein IJS96_09565 [Schwartzia sp.]|nr:hypothetical protein [Schwartzia sp. (in: firmicutes)]